MADQLTPPQQSAVEHFEGPLMVLAGPGSGKTRVITYRIARLLEQGATPDEILALTFTNKAAREMSERVHKLLGGVRVQVSTFHRFCAQLLRRFPEQVGLKPNFTILDASDQTQLVRRIMKDIGFDAMSLDPRRVLNRISKARNELITAEQFRTNYEERVGDPIDAVVYEVFPEYELQILHQNSVDFDALLLHVVNMLGENEELREFLDRLFRFVLVDEYQDTNLAQYRIVLALSQVFPNLCATGDPDQSIYGWRGARPENIVQFERDFPGTKIVSLDQNFRSTAAIVRNADKLICNNPRRHRSPLFTKNDEGESVKLRIFSNAEDEANGIAHEIAELVQSGKRRFADFAIFYRVNALSRSLETAFSRHGVPFQVAAGYSFFERAEVRDLVGYLRLIENPSDNVAFLRIINRPARGLGEKTIERVAKFALQHDISLLEATSHYKDIPSLTKRSQNPLKAFSELMATLSQRATTGTVHGLIERLISEINYMSLWKDENDEVDQDRRANVHELINAARLYEETEKAAGRPASLQGFLEMSSLTSEADSVDATCGAVTLMTMHAAKGLEFPVVYIIGVENGLIPHDRAVQNGDPASFQEERRLLFVGVTRAMQELNLT
ncbi:MAG: UvrD-helicase domain-containing protein, partial [Fuerstiella sp.]